MTSENEPSQERYRHTEDMGEISGFGGGYEKCCQDMLEAGVKWLIEHKQANIQVLENSAFYGIIKEGTPETKELTEVVIAAANGQATGAMHHAVMVRLNYVAKHGWDKYCEELRKAEKASA